MKSLYVIVACVVVALLVPPVQAGPLDDASAAYHRGDFAAALKLIRPLAEQGDARAQANLGVLYENGQGVPQDDTEAAKWYRKAADQGDASAQFKLGGLYWQGKGVPRDGEEAFKWYMKSAEQGYADAQNTIGVMYWTGRGIAQSDATAKQWFQKAAAQGHAKARKNLQEMEEKGRLALANPPEKTPKKAPPGAAATAPAPAPAGDYRVQLGSVKSEAAAETEAVRLRRLHREILGDLTIAQVRADLGERGVYYRLRAGPLKDAAAATALCHELAARNQGCIVIAPAKAR
jgi:cell division septation protein DedD